MLRDKKPLKLYKTLLWPVMLSEKKLALKGKNQHKLELNRAGRPKKGKVYPVMTTGPNWKKKDFTCFLGRIQPMTSHGLFVYYNSLNFLFPSIELFSPSYHLGTYMCLTITADPKLSFSANPQ